ncbi:MAG: Hsp20/alpha crystallin family protein [Anaerolineaceae bacterium]|nr:Hsp20/alpha crystallin family protein [Anaerolineaceae bacterium]
MTVVRWNPFREMLAMQRAMDRMFDEGWRGSDYAGDTLGVDVYETDDAYTVIAALPGINPENINVRLHDGTLSIAAEIPQMTLPENARMLVQERPFGTVRRSIHLGGRVNQEKVEATYESGLLTLVIPKSEEAQPKLIPVKTTKKLISHN